MKWCLSDRADVAALRLADRHYNRQKVGSSQYVPPGRCVAMLTECGRALWVTSWPFAQYVKHAWPGAWVNSLFRNEGAGLSSNLIRQAIAATRAVWQPPELGMVTFVDPEEVPGVMVRGERIFGYCYKRAGFKHVGFTKAGLWAWQIRPDGMPEPNAAQPRSMHGTPLFDSVCA